MFRVDRTASAIKTFRAADNHVKYWSARPLEERLKAAYYLSKKTWGIHPDVDPPVDRTRLRTRHSSMASTLFGPDFLYFVKALNAAEVGFILVGD